MFMGLKVTFLLASLVIIITTIGVIYQNNASRMDSLKSSRKAPVIKKENSAGSPVEPDKPILSGKPKDTIEKDEEDMMSSAGPNTSSPQQTSPVGVTDSDKPIPSDNPKEETIINEPPRILASQGGGGSTLSSQPTARVVDESGLVDAVDKSTMTAKGKAATESPAEIGKGTSTGEKNGRTKNSKLNKIRLDGADDTISSQLTTAVVEEPGKSELKLLSEKPKGTIKQDDLLSSLSSQPNALAASYKNSKSLVDHATTDSQAQGTTEGLLVEAPLDPAKSSIIDKLPLKTPTEAQSNPYKFAPLLALNLSAPKTVNLGSSTVESNTKTALNHQRHSPVPDNSSITHGSDADTLGINTVGLDPSSTVLSSDTTTLGSGTNTLRSPFVSTTDTTTDSSTAADSFADSHSQTSLSPENYNRLKIKKRQSEDILATHDRRIAQLEKDKKNLPRGADATPIRSDLNRTMRLREETLAKIDRYSAQLERYGKPVNDLPAPSLMQPPWKNPGKLS